MAKFQITHSCGHTVMHQLYGPVKDRQGKADWLAERPCYECYQAERAREREEQNRAAAQANRDNHLPVLTGSDKQVAWAESIRASMIPALKKIRHQIAADLNREGATEALDIADGAMAETSAAWWIDNHRTCSDEDDNLVFAHCLKWVKTQYEKSGIHPKSKDK
jgi:hypothetical protein